jgi:hypothetical protein
MDNNSKCQVVHIRSQVVLNESQVVLNESQVVQNGSQVVHNGSQMGRIFMQSNFGNAPSARKFPKSSHHINLPSILVSEPAEDD